MDHETIEATAANAGEATRALAKLHEALATLPFFGTGKVVWFKDCNFLGDDRTAKSKEVSGGLADLAAMLKTFEWAGVQLLISGGRADKRKTFFKTLTKAGHVEEFVALSVDDRDWQAKAEQLVTATLKALKKNPDYAAVTELAQLVGPNNRALASEYLWAVKTDRKKSVIGLVAGLVSKVRSLLFARELLRTRRLNPSRAYGQFKSQLDGLSAEDFPADRKISPLGMHPFVLFNATNQARNYKRAELIAALDLLLVCNRRLVSSSLEDRFLIQQTLIQIVNKEAVAA